MTFDSAHNNALQDKILTSVPTPLQSVNWLASQQQLVDPLLNSLDPQ